MAPVALTSPAVGIGARFSELAAARGDDLALVCATSRLSFAELERRANRLARVLRDRGVTRDAVVAMGMPNGVAFVTAALAIWKLGATPLPLSLRMPERERSEILALGRPALTIGGIGVSFDTLEDEAVTASADRLEDVAGSWWKAIGTGGSTGRPKLVLDAAVDREAFASGARAFGMEAGMRQLVAGPLYHNGPFVFSMIHLLSGGTIVLMERFDARDYLDLLDEESVGWSFVVPTMLHRLVREVEANGRAPRGHHLRTLLLSGGACGASLKLRAMGIFGAEKVCEYYGSTEVGGALIRGDEWLAHEGSVGRPLPGAEFRIVGEDGELLPPGEIGEIFIKPASPPRFRYLGAEPVVRGEFTSVGDLGWLDADGFLFVADRRVDMIKTGGVNVYPAEIEVLLLDHAGIQDVVVVGLRDPEWGRRVHAIIEPLPGVELSDEELASYCRDRLHPHKVPKTWEMVTALPRDPSGKIRRLALRDERDNLPYPRPAPDKAAVNARV